MADVSSGLRLLEQVIGEKQQVRIGMSVHAATPHKDGASIQMSLVRSP